MTGQLLVLNLPEGQVNSFADILLSLGDFMLPKLLHCSCHDDERPMPSRKSHRFPARLVPDSELSSRPQ